jgi:nucleoside-diphosphate-sugar epimerase
MNILVTGGWGFIGHNVVKRLCEQGHEVIVVDNKTTYGVTLQSELDYLINGRLQKLQGFHPAVYNCDITDREKVETIFNIEQPEIVIHLASFPRQKVVKNNPQYGSRVMIEGLINLLEASDLYEVRKFVHISSSMVYGDFADNTKEDAPCNPQGQYGIMKYTGELLVRDYTRRTNIAHTIIRPSAVYGPLDVTDRVVSKFIVEAMNDGILDVNGANEMLDFTYVDDIADGIVGAALSDNTDNKTYNITRGRSQSLLDAANTVINLVGKGSVNIRDKSLDFPSRGMLSIENAQKDFGYTPKIDIEEGFKKYYEWLQDTILWSKPTI